jgi:hypothetical protein
MAQIEKILEDNEDRWYDKVRIVAISHAMDPLKHSLLQ